MENATAPHPSRLDAREWSRILQTYCEPSLAQSIREMLLTFVPFFALWALSYAAYVHVGLWLSLILALPTGAFLVRFFLIQHDCGHYSFFKSKAINDWVGRALGVFTLTPYAFWQRTHAIHHATHGNLERRGIGDIDTLTISEYRALGYWGRLRYRVYRHPIVLFVIGPAYLFLLQHRLPVTQMDVGWKPWVSAMSTNVAIAVLFAAMMWLVGVVPFIAVHLPVIVIASSIGVWMFYVQHQFEDTTWEHDGEWEMKTAALYGSSHYDLPQPLRWLTANIGVHHVHHLVSRIPFYRLHEAIEDHPELAGMGRITLVDSLKTVKLALWDEAQKKMVTFREASAAVASASATA